MLEEALETRAWRPRLRDDDYIFVLRQVPDVEELQRWLCDRWPGCRQVVLSQLTGGALLSATAGAAIAGLTEVLVIDLADILFPGGPANPDDVFRANVGACVPCFRSDDADYSYLRFESGRVVEAAEKRVISDRASSGVYMFRDPAVFLSAVAYSIAHRDTLAFRGKLFVCPAVNGVLAAGFDVESPLLETVTPVGKAFHTSA